MARSMEELASDDEVVGEVMPNNGDPDHHHHHEPFSNDSRDSVDSVTGVMERSIHHCILSDLHLLDCSICSEPLTVPVFQCKNGHIACSACSANLCGTCFTPINFSRCRAIENVLQCIKVTCQYANFGCKKTMSYNEKKNHEEECIYVPCFCPISECNFVASSKLLSTHVREKHEASRIQFSYDHSFLVSFDDDVREPFVFQEQSDGTLFVLNKDIWRLGFVVSITCIGPTIFNSCSESGYPYDILAKSQGCEVKLESITKNVLRRTLALLSSVYLVIPFDLDSPEPLNLEICIRNRHSGAHSHECRIP
ncbi:E3 ubiquitin-protein ligase SINA-like 7 [Lotus japonicus]|uniref:E3 ubiquitin-protein ligase SINA-like 7 n=1 Tax=Lotus japonicus TaxID=34305 RepID=UPI002582CE48|nr:E3 ubiquitin-protein ligase SINA-like 7 [Lotus japonicus]